MKNSQWVNDNNNNNNNSNHNDDNNDISQRDPKRKRKAKDGSERWVEEQIKKLRGHTKILSKEK